MKVVFMGTPEFAVPTLDALIAHHEVLAVFTQPDRPKGRGKKLTAPPVKEVALKHEIPVYQPEKIRAAEWVECLESYKPDAIVVVAYGQLLTQAILDIPKWGCVNVHGSLLPKYRGAAPIQWAVANGEEVTGITTMLMDKGLDTGDMLLKDEVPIEKDTSSGDLYNVLSKRGAALLIETLKGLEKGLIVPIKQNDEEASYASLLNKRVSQIDWSMRAKDIANRIRGFNPWPLAHTTYDGETLKIFSAEVLESHAFEGEVGEIVSVTSDEVYVLTGEGILKIKEIQMGSQKRMPVAAYLLGRSIACGLVLGASKED